MEAQILKYEKQELVEAYVVKMKANVKTLEDSFAHLKSEVAMDLKDIDETELIKEQNKNIHYLHKYITRLAEEQYTFKKIKSSASKMEAELLDYYRFHWDKSTKLSETAISKYATNHACYMAVNDYMKLAEIINSYLENIISTFKDRNYAIKNMIEVRKINLGM